MDRSYFVTTALCIVASIITGYIVREDQPLNNSADALKTLTQTGSVTVVQDTLVYTLMGDELTYYELNALKYLADDFAMVRVSNLETRYAKQQLFEYENGIKPEDPVEFQVEANDKARSGE